MKTFQITLIFILNSISIFSQIDTAFYNSSWHKTDRAEAVFYRIIHQSDSLYYIKDIDKSGRVLMKGVYSSLNPEIENGNFVFYNKKGDKTIEGQFCDGKPVKKWIYYDKKGNVEKTLNYNDIPKYDSSLNFNNLLTENPVVNDMPVFNNGDISKFTDYLKSNFILPPIVKKYGISGRVFVQFIVDKNGQMVNVKVQRSISPQVDCEIKRVIATAPRWRPAEQNGKKIAVPFTIPMDINSGSL